MADYTMPLHGNYWPVASGTPEWWRCTACPKAVITVPENGKESQILINWVILDMCILGCVAE